MSKKKQAPQAEATVEQVCTSATSHCNRPSEIVASMLLPRAVRLQARTTPAASEPAKLVSDKVLEVWSAKFSSTVSHWLPTQQQTPDMQDKSASKKNKRAKALAVVCPSETLPLIAAEKGFHVQSTGV